MRTTLAAVVLVSLMTMHSGAQQAPPAPDVQKLGPQAGERVPDFTLTNQSGRPRTLESLVGAKGLMLVFFRSADW